MNHLARNAVAVLAAVAASAVVFAGPAQAGTRVTVTAAAVTTARVAPQATSDCPVHYACLWVNTNWSGSTHWQGQFNNPTLPSSINNKASSSFNNGTSCTAHFTSNAGYAGNVLPEGIGSIRQNLALNLQPDGTSWDNTIESLYWCSKG